MSLCINKPSSRPGFGLILAPLQILHANMLVRSNVQSGCKWFIVFTRTYDFSVNTCVNTLTFSHSANMQMKRKKALMWLLMSRWKHTLADIYIFLRLARSFVFAHMMYSTRILSFTSLGDAAMHSVSVTRPSTPSGRHNGWRPMASEATVGGLLPLCFFSPLPIGFWLYTYSVTLV